MRTGVCGVAITAPPVELIAQVWFVADLPRANPVRLGVPVVGTHLRPGLAAAGIGAHGGVHVLDEVCGVMSRWQRRRGHDLGLRADGFDVTLVLVRSVDAVHRFGVANESTTDLAAASPVTEKTGLGGSTFPELMATEGKAEAYDCVTSHPYTNFGRDFGNGRTDPWDSQVQVHDQHMIGNGRATKLVDDLAAEVERHGKPEAYAAVIELG